MWPSKVVIKVVASALKRSKFCIHRSLLSRFRLIRLRQTHRPSLDQERISYNLKESVLASLDVVAGGVGGRRGEAWRRRELGRAGMVRKKWSERLEEDKCEIEGVGTVERENEAEILDDYATDDE